MKKRAHLYVIAAAPANVIPISSACTPRERSWRDLLRRLAKNPPASAVVVNLEGPPQARPEAN